MPIETSKQEASAIESAYEAQVQLLFQKLVLCMGDQPVTRETDQQCVKKFLAGLEVAKRARQLARNAILARSPATASAARRRKPGSGRR